MSDQSSRKWIVDALSSLPGKTRNKNLVGNLRKFAELSERSKESLVSALDGSGRVKIVFPSAQMTGMEDKVSKECQEEGPERCPKGAFSKHGRGFESFVRDSNDRHEGSCHPTPLRPVLEAWQKFH